MMRSLTQIRIGGPQIPQYKESTIDSDSPTHRFSDPQKLLSAIFVKLYFRN